MQYLNQIIAVHQKFTMAKAEALIQRLNSSMTKSGYEMSPDEERMMEEIKERMANTITKG